MILLGCREGITKIFNEYPSIKMMIGVIDPVLLTESKYIAPGLGDFGDRYFGTTEI
jgi:uracil phosphoribosyltransferase